jgi:hypothetical protein
VPRATTGLRFCIRRASRRVDGRVDTLAVDEIQEWERAPINRAAPKRCAGRVVDEVTRVRRTDPVTVPR